MPLLSTAAYVRAFFTHAYSRTRHVTTMHAHTVTHTLPTDNGHTLNKSTDD